MLPQLFLSLLLSFSAPFPAKPGSPLCIENKNRFLNTIAQIFSTTIINLNLFEDKSQLLNGEIFSIIIINTNLATF